MQLATVTFTDFGKTLKKSKNIIKKRYKKEIAYAISLFLLKSKHFVITLRFKHIINTRYIFIT